jgi:hypothetical protein
MRNMCVVSVLHVTATGPTDSQPPYFLNEKPLNIPLANRPLAILPENFSSRLICVAESITQKIMRISGGMHVKPDVDVDQRSRSNRTPDCIE